MTERLSSTATGAREMHSFFSKKKFILVFSAFFSVFFFLGCAHEATEAECRMVVEKQIDLFLGSGLGPEERAKRRAEHLKNTEVDVHSCIGKKVTKSYLHCVEASQSVSDLEACGKN